MISVRHYLITLTALCFTRTAYCFSSISESPLLSRRDAFLTTAALISSVTICHPASAATDLSQYKDGPRGLKYLVTSQGSGTAKPLRAQKVKTSYSLFLDGFPEDGGKPVDSSKGLFGDKPFEFNVGVSEVIKGWDLSLMDMVEGEARRLVIPPDLGYGEKGAGGRIPGGATLYFEVQLTENGKIPVINEGQKKWLEEHPL
jgi:peptidylprolyl isomerase